MWCGQVIHMKLMRVCVIWNNNHSLHLCSDRVFFSGKWHGIECSREPQPVDALFISFTGLLQLCWNPLSCQLLPGLWRPPLWSAPVQSKWTPRFCFHASSKWALKRGSWLITLAVFLPSTWHALTPGWCLIQNWTKNDL